MIGFASQRLMELEVGVTVELGIPGPRRGSYCPSFPRSTLPAPSCAPLRNLADLDAPA